MPEVKLYLPTFNTKARIYLAYIHAIYQQQGIFWSSLIYKYMFLCDLELTFVFIIVTGNVLIHGSQCWATKSANERSMQVAEM